MKLSKDQTLKGLRKVEEGWRLGGTGQYADLLGDVAGGAENLMGEASTLCRRLAVDEE